MNWHVKGSLHRVCLWFRFDSCWQGHNWLRRKIQWNRQLNRNLHASISDRQLPIIRRCASLRNLGFDCLCSCLCQQTFRNHKAIVSNKTSSIHAKIEASPSNSQVKVRWKPVDTSIPWFRRFSCDEKSTTFFWKSQQATCSKERVHHI